MPVPIELRPFFAGLVDKSRRGEIRWEADGKTDAFRARFSRFSIAIRQDERKPAVHVELRNDQGQPASIITVDQGDEEWIGAVSLINSANLKVRKVGETLRYAMAELEKEGTIGLGPEDG